MNLLKNLWVVLSLALMTNTHSQTVDQTTGNLINTGTSPTDTTSTWNNGVYVNTLCFYAGEPGNCGPNPSIRNGGYINFSYGTTDLNQVVNINKALSAGGTGVQLSGFNFGFMAKNGNGWDDGRQDYLAAYVKFYNAGGGLAANYDYSNQTNQKYNWTNFQFSETFASPIAASNYSNAQVGFVGRDNNFWAGNYGPEIYNVSFSLKYRVDPCATNPAYSSTCVGFSNVINTNNLLDSTQGGSSLNQAFAINTALQNAGVGATIHGFNYGFNYRVGESWSGCTATNQDGSCSWYMNIPSSAKATVSLTNSSNQLLYSKSYTFTGDGTSGSISEKFLLPSSLNQSLLGMGRIQGSATGTNSSIEGAWATMIYTPDPCATNPLYSPTCTGYGAAMAKQLASVTTTTAAPTTVETVAVATPTATNTNTSVTDTSTATSSAPIGSVTAGPTIVSAPAPVVSSSTTTATSSSSSSSQTTKESSGSSGGNVSLALSIISKNSERDAAGAAIAQSAVAQAQATANQAQQEAVSIAAQAVSNSITAGQAALKSDSNNSGSSRASSSSSVHSDVLQSANQVNLVIGPNVSNNNSSTQKQEQVSTTMAIVTESRANTTVETIQPMIVSNNESNRGVDTAITTTNNSLPILAPQQNQVATSLSLPTPATASAQQATPEQSTQTQAIYSLLPPQQQPVQVSVSPVVTSTVSQQVTQEQPIQTQSIYSLLPPQQQSAQVYLATIDTSTRSIQQSTSVAQQITQEQSTQTQSIYSLLPPPQQPLQVPTQQMATLEVSQPQSNNTQQSTQTSTSETYAMVSPNLVTDKSNPLTDIVEGKQNIPQNSTIATVGSSVNKNVGDNDVAGGVSINKMAIAPVGYGDYLNLTLRDVAFYAPKEVYKNQRNVDNARLLRQLSSDSKHKEMVDMQYVR